MARRLPAIVWWLGLVSFLNDAASEMVIPLLPALVTGTLGGSALALGQIEGTATLVGSLVKYGGGWLADRSGQHGALVIGGYALSNVVRPLAAVVSSSGALLAMRVADRIGKGLRTAPRDAIIAESTAADQRASAFSVHRALDHAGTILGAGLAVALVSGLGFSVPAVFAASAIPGLFVVIAAVVAMRNDPRENIGRVKPARAAVGNPSGIWRVGNLARLLPLLIPIVVSRLGLASELFLLLFAGRFVPLWAVPLLWGALHLVKTGASLGSALAARRVGSRALVAAGWSMHAMVFGGFALAAIRWNAVFAGSAHDGMAGEATRSLPVPEGAVVAIVGLFCAWGLYAGLCEGAEKDLIAARAEPGKEGGAFGIYHLVVGMAALPASVGFGFVWDSFGPAAAFAGGSALAAAAAGFLVLTPSPRR